MTEEIKNLVSKKHDYFQMLNFNKRSVDNLKMFFENIKNMFRKQINLIPNNNDDKIKNIQNYINLIETELKGNEDEIIENINLNKLIIKDIIPAKRKEKKIIKDEINDKYKGDNHLINTNNSPKIVNKNVKKEVLFPKIPEKRQYLNSVNKQRVKDKEIGIPNKYEYLSSKDKSPPRKNDNLIEKYQINKDQIRLD